jgi:ABC-type iron transport system FetAB ATPase subunit
MLPLEKLTVAGLCYGNNGPLDFVLHSGECACLSGVSGSGKTLLLRALADLDAHRGEVRLAGRLCGEIAAPQWRGQVGMLPAESAWWHERVGMHFAAARQDWLAALGFTEAALDWRVSRLSSGERQRLALLRMLLKRPEVLLLDEPTANLDQENTRRVEDLLRAYRLETGAAMLWVSHDPAQIGRIAQRHFYLSAGRLELAPIAPDSPG